MTTDHTADPERDLIRRLLAGVDTVPPEVTAAAKGSLTWRTIDAELASLAFDSIDHSELVGTRGSGGPRSISFEYRETSIEIEIDDTPGGATILGQVAPVAPTSIELTRDDGLAGQPVTPDRSGSFRFDRIRAGRFRLLLRFAPGAGPAQLLTEWLTI